MMSGQAASYYQQDQMQSAPQTEYPPNQPYYNHAGMDEYKNSEYQQGFASQQAPQRYPTENPPSYDDLFKIEKPKFHDIWAGLLVSNYSQDCQWYPLC